MLAEDERLPSEPTQLVCAFSHVLAYTLQTSVLRGTADKLLDATSYDVRWLLFPELAAGAFRSLTRIRRPAALLRFGFPDPDFQIGRWLVTAGPPARPGWEAAAAVAMAALYQASPQSLEEKKE